MRSERDCQPDSKARDSIKKRGHVANRRSYS